MKQITGAIGMLQLLPCLWLVAWLFAPCPEWTWQWVPAVASQLSLYSASLFAAYKGFKSLRRERVNTRNNR